MRFTSLLLLTVGGLLVSWSSPGEGHRHAPEMSAMEASLGASVAAPAAAPLAIAKERELEEIALELEVTPNDPMLLLEAANAAFALSDDDLAIWYAELARLAAKGTKLEKKINGKVKAIRGDIGLDIPPVGEAVDDHAKAIFQFAKLCQSAKLYANAADVLGSLTRTPYAGDAQKRLESMFKSKKAIGALLESGVPVKVKVRQKRSAKKTAALNEKHSDWEDPHVIEGKNYTVRTNMGIDMAEKILNAMEQMNVFYRKVFEYKKSGMRSCEVRVWATRDGFDENNPGTGATVAGFYRPDKNDVSTYDPRTAEGFMQQPIEELWSTLYHEASHQFTRMIWKVLIPTWLNEGTASYFEGAALLPGGYVETNRIPESRLRSLVSLLGGLPKTNASTTELPEESPRSPGLKKTVSYFQPGSYPGEYYPFGWGLVYFCMNYENDDSERIYLPIYKAFMRSYTDTGEERNPFKRFERYFVTDPAFEGIETFEDFERRWKIWIFDLYRMEFGEPQVASTLIRRARKQIDNDETENAVATLRWALRKRIDDPLALRLVGDSLKELGNKDAALFSYRRLVAVARAARKADKDLKHYDGTAEEALRAGLDGINDINSALGGILEKQYDSFVKDALAEAEAWVEADYPRVGLQVLAMANDVVGGEGRLLARSDELRKESSLDVRRTRRMPSTPELEDWRISGDGWFAIKGEGHQTGLYRETDGVGEAVLIDEPPVVYRMDVDVVVTEKTRAPILGLTFAGTTEGDRTWILFGKSGRSGIMLYDPETGETSFDPQFESGHKFKVGEPFKLTIDVAREVTTFFVNDEEIGKIERPAAAFAGTVGMFTQGTPVRFQNARLTY